MAEGLNGHAAKPKTFSISKSFESSKNGMIHIRNANTEDADAIASLGAKVFSDTFAYSMEPKDLKVYLDASYTISAIEGVLSNPQKYTIVATQMDQVVAFATLSDGPIEPEFINVPKPVELQRIYLYAEQQGTGLGKFLVEESIAMAQALGYQTMLLGVWEDNFKAQKLYAKLGFVKVGQRDFVLGDTRQTDWVLSKNL